MYACEYDDKNSNTRFSKKDIHMYINSPIKDENIPWRFFGGVYNIHTY